MDLELDAIRVELIHRMNVKNDALQAEIALQDTEIARLNRAVARYRRQIGRKRGVVLTDPRFRLARKR